MTAIAERPARRPLPLVTDGEPPMPCTCGGVLVWNPLREAWDHCGDVCLPCATAGDAYCADTCPNPAVFCSHAEPVTCGNCSEEITVEGCPGCRAATVDPADPTPDPDRAYELHRERAW